MDNKKIRLGAIGLGGRGFGTLKVLAAMPDVEIAALCDHYDDRIQRAVAAVKDIAGYEPKVFSDHRKLLELKDIEAVTVAADWRAHVGICLDAMEAGKYVGTEVGCANNVQQCFDIVKTSKRTGIPCMMLENCCYNRTEMTILNMVKKGLFGELVSAGGGYMHDLRKEVTGGKENRHYRLRNYLNRCGELYPTHELGPIAKWLGINRGNRMLTLVSVASKSAGMEAYVKEKLPPDHHLAGVKFNEGDIVNTIITCAHGETITLTHSTSLPRPYSRQNMLAGTKGIYSEDINQSVYFEGVSEGEKWEPLEKYYAEYEHPLWRKKITNIANLGHGGMDYHILRAFITSVQEQTDTPIDVYDTATWMAIGPLSEESIAMGGHPVAIPDFTEGAWLEREPVRRGPYCLDEVCEEFFTD